MLSQHGGFSDWGPRTPSSGTLIQEGQGHTCHALQTKGMNLQKHLQAQGTQDFQTRHEDLGRLQDHVHRWDQLHPGKKSRRMKGGEGQQQFRASCVHDSCTCPYTCE